MKRIIFYFNLLLFSFLLFNCSGNGLTRDFIEEVDDIPSEHQTDLKLIVGSYNLRLITSSDLGVRHWDNRKQWAKKRIQDHDFDILGTQEGVFSQLDDLTQGTEYQYIAQGRDNGTTQGETCGIIFKKDKFSVLKSGTFWFSLTPETPSYGWDANIRRICTWVQFKDLEGGKTFYFFNAHFDHEGIVARLESAKMMLTKINEIAGNSPVIFTGDLNAEPTTEPIELINSSNILWDTRTSTSTPAVGPVGTSYGYDLSKQPTSRIDYVFVNKSIDVKSFKVIDDDFTTGNIASDHLPIRAEIEF